MTSPRAFSIFGMSNPYGKRFLALVAIGLWSALLLVFLLHLAEEAFRKPPSMRELEVTQGEFKARGLCSGKGRVRGFDITLLLGESERTVRVPCVTELESLSLGQPIALYVQQVVPLFDWPAHNDLWHAMSGSRVLYSYDSRLARHRDYAWFAYVLVGLAFVTLVPLSWYLSTWAWKEANLQPAENDA